MSEHGKIIVVKEGSQVRPKIECKGKKLDFKVEFLSKALCEAYNKSPESLQGKEVTFERNKNGLPTRITEVGVAYEKQSDPAHEVVNQNSVAPTSMDKNTITVKNIDQRELVLSTGEHVSKRDTAICELNASKDKPVVKRNRMWIRSDYNCERPKCYPFNFVHAPKNPKPDFKAIPKLSDNQKTLEEDRANFFKEHCHLDHGRFANKAHTGIIEVELTALSPLIVSHPPGRDSVLSEDERKVINQVYENAKRPNVFGETEIDGKNRNATYDERMQRIRPPYQVGPGQYALPATSLKGMIRSMVEAYSHSLMGSLSACLKGDKDEGKAQIRSRTNGRDTRAGLGRGEATIYTYEWNMSGRTWRRWVKCGDTPWDKLSHVNPEVNPLRLSLADAMFGRVFQDSKDIRDKSAIPALRGRIRFSEAVGWDETDNSTVKVADDYWFLKSLTRPSGAKAKCEALYLLPDKSGKVAEYNDKASEARGRKMYWPHSMGDATQQGAQPLTWMRDEIAAKSQDELWKDAKFNAAVKAFQQRVQGHKESQASTKSWVKPLLPGSTFRFSIRFENLTDVELGALLKAITLENTPESATHCHRLGRAKPLGFGSVVLSVKDVKLWDVQTATKTLQPAEAFWFEKESVKTKIENANKEFEKFCTKWKQPVWEDIAALTAIPTKLTDLDYWKKWTDYQPRQNEDHPLPLPQDAKP